MRDNSMSITFKNLDIRDDLYSTAQSKQPAVDQQNNPHMNILQHRFNQGEGPIRNHSVSKNPPITKFMQNNEYFQE